MTLPRTKMTQGLLGITAIIVSVYSCLQLYAQSEDGFSDSSKQHDAGMNAEGPTELLNEPRRVFPRVQEEILSQYAATDDTSEHAKLKSLLQKAVLEEFAFRQAKRRTALDRLAKELQRLETLHSRREKEKTSIVASRVEQLIRDKVGLGWGATGSPFTSNEDAGEAFSLE